MIYNPPDPPEDEDYWRSEPVDEYVLDYFEHDRYADEEERRCAAELAAYPVRGMGNPAGCSAAVRLQPDRNETRGERHE